MKNKNRDWLDKKAPKHLKTNVLSGALYIHTSKDKQEQVERTAQVLNKLGSELASYAITLVHLPRLMKLVMDTPEFKEFGDQLHTQTVH
jgi:predicted MPP superfamily phosphohydrolase|tara:strand:+ start:131 stop:397 length:267 start_codon:yes stop_codon:yes gene_type:complete